MIEDAVGYFLKVGLTQTVFYLLYFFLFKNTSFFNLNRAYLLFTLLLSFVIPIIALPVEADVNSPALSMLTLSPGNFNESEIASAPSSIQEETFQANIQLYVAIFYLSVVFLLLLRSILGVKRVLELKRAGNSFTSGNVTIFHISGIDPFCFLNMVFIDPARANAAIILHEQAHVKYYHWIDLLVMELAGIICWFNPVIWIYKSALKQQHEYLADEYVIGNGIPARDYLEFILRFISIEEPIGPVNKFNSQSLKNRIVMMTKNKSSFTSKLFYLAAIPAVCVVIFAFSKKESGTLIHSLNKEIVVVIDAAHGGSDKGALSSTGMAEKDLALSMASQIKKVGERQGLKIVLTRSADETLTLEDRVTFAKKANADVFLSLHFAFNEKSDVSGIECYVSEDKTKFSESQKVSASLMDELKSLQGISVNNVKSSSAFILKGNTAPSVILELGYLSNTNDIQFISDKKNQEVIAEKIIVSLLRIK
jgi:N-acetylmuramoyl-L-alanine amidase